MVEAHKERFQGPAASSRELLTDRGEGDLAGLHSRMSDIAGVLSAKSSYDYAFGNRFFCYLIDIGAGHHQKFSREHDMSLQCRGPHQSGGDIPSRYNWILSQD